VTDGGIPPFAEAVSQLRDFFVSQGVPSQLRWVFLDDVLHVGPTGLVLLEPSNPEADELAAKVYADGAAHGLVQLVAIGTHNGEALTSAWFPKYPDEQVQGWEAGLKLSIKQPLPEALAVPRWLAGLFRLSPGYRAFSAARRTDLGTYQWARSAGP